MDKEHIKIIKRLIEKDFELILNRKYNVSLELIEECSLMEDYELSKTVVLFTILNNCGGNTMFQMSEIIRKAIDDFYREYLVDCIKCDSLSSLMSKSIIESENEYNENRIVFKMGGHLYELI